MEEAGEGAAERVGALVDAVAAECARACPSVCGIPGVPTLVMEQVHPDVLAATARGCGPACVADLVRYVCGDEVRACLVRAAMQSDSMAVCLTAAGGTVGAPIAPTVECDAPMVRATVLVLALVVFWYTLFADVFKSPPPPPPNAPAAKS